MIGWATEALIASTLLMALVLLARAPVRRAFGSGVAYALWAIPAIRLILPPLPRLPAWRDAAAPQLTQRATETLSLYVIEPLGGSAAAPSILPQVGLALAALWAVGATGFLAWHALSHWRFCRLMLAHSTCSERAGNIDVIETEAAAGPLAFGIFRRYVAFPRDFAERYDADERELALLHELGHHQRGDLIANWIALAVLAVHWFNPLAWRAFRAFRADQEMANDARVLAGRPAIDRHTYACAIVKAAHGGAVSAACHLHTIQDLKGRLRMLTTGRRSRLSLTLGGAAVAALTIGGLAGTASGTTAANTVRAGVENATGIDFAKLGAKLQTAPTPPAADGADLPLPPASPESAMPPAKPGQVRNVRIVTVDKDGKTTAEDAANGLAEPHGPTKYTANRIIVRTKDGKSIGENYVGVPVINTVNCRNDGKGGIESDEMVVNKVERGKRMIVICKDRIDRMVTMSMDKAANAKSIQRTAYTSALAGLRSAREKIAADPRLSAEGKNDALAGIDESIRDMEKDLAQPN